MTHSNQKTVAEAIVNQHQSNPQPVVLISQPQSGKTGVGIETLNMWIPTQVPYPPERSIPDFVNWREKVQNPDELSIIIGGPSDNTLKNQNEARFKGFRYSYSNNPEANGDKILNDAKNVCYVKCSDGKQFALDVAENVKNAKSTFSFLDEAHLNMAFDGKIDKNYLQLLHNRPRSLNIWNSATPTFVAGTEGDKHVFYLPPGEDYYGISDFLKDGRIRDPYDLSRGKTPKQQKFAWLRIYQFYSNVLVPNLLKPVVAGSDRNIGVVRIASEADASYLKKTILDLLPEEHKKSFVIQIFNSNAKNIPVLGDSPDWLGEAAIDLPANKIPKLAIIINSYAQGFTIPAKNRIAFWHGQYRKNPTSNTAALTQCATRNCGYPVKKQNGETIPLSELKYPLYMHEEVAKHAKEFYDWCAENADPGGLILNYKDCPHFWTNSNLKKKQQTRTDQKVRNCRVGKTAKELRQWWKNYAKDRSDDGDPGITHCAKVIKRNWAHDIANDLLGGQLKKGRNTGLYGIISFEGVAWDRSNSDHLAILKKYPQVDPDNSTYVGDFLYLDCELIGNVPVTNKTAAPKYM